MVDNVNGTYFGLFRDEGSGRVRVGAQFRPIFSFASGVLTVVGTPFNDTLTVLNVAGTIKIRIDAIGTLLNTGLAAASVTSVMVSGLGGNDVLKLDNSLGAAVSGTLLGGGGSDTLSGGLGADSLNGGDANDLLYFDNLDTSVIGGAGVDTASVRGATTAVSMNLVTSQIETVSATTSTFNNTFNAAGATFIVNVTGGSGNDTIRGGNLNDQLSGGAGNDSLIGGPGDDSYVFGPATSTEADTLTESSGQGTDTLSFAGLTTALTLNLGTSLVQTVHFNRTLQLNSAGVIENLIGGSSNDTLTGNSLANVLTGNAGGDTLTGAAGNDFLIGGPGDDSYVFRTATIAEADTVAEVSGQGTDTLNFSAMTTAVTLNLGTSLIQTVHTNRTVKLSSSATFENITSGSADDVLFGNSAGNVLNGGAGRDIVVGNSGNDTLNGDSGRDILIGGLGLDTINGGSDYDILIAGRTTNDSNMAGLIAVHAEWISGGTYASRIANLRSGVGSPVVSMKAKMNVLNDAGEDDVLTGGSETDWYFKAIDDVITDLFGVEITDVL